MRGATVQEPALQRDLKKSQLLLKCPSASVLALNFEHLSFSGTNLANKIWILFLHDPCGGAHLKWIPSNALSGQEDQGAPDAAAHLNHLIQRGQKEGIKLDGGGSSVLSSMLSKAFIADWETDFCLSPTAAVSTLCPRL